MDQKLLQDKITKTIHNKDPKAVAYLFGSRARGDFRPDSDWDILILVDANKVTNEIEDNFRDDLYAVVNRLYYSCFYSVIAFLLKNDIEIQSHDGART